jgi:putative transcriptional regulator
MNAVCKLFLVALSLGAAGSATAQQSAQQGDLLVASPTMPDSSFSESVMLLLRHDDNGSLGVLVNRPTTLSPSAVFAELAELVGYDGTLFYGGPVLPTRLPLLLQNPPAALTEGPPVFGDVFVSGDPGLLTWTDGWTAQPGNLRLFAGHAAWEPGQLDAEIAEGHWSVVAGRADLVFSDAPLEIWQRALGAEGEVVVGLR